MGERVTVEGTVENVIFHNEENGYTILRLETTDEGEEVTVVGTMPGINPGEGLSVHGQWTRHSTYGEQFKAEIVERRMPVGEKALLEYLASGAIKGIGKATARQLIENFGEDALRVIEEEPEKLAKIKGISLNKAREMGQSFCAQFGLREVVMTFAGYGLTPNEALRCYKKFGPTTLMRIKANPYLLCTSGLYIGFDRADQVALAMNGDKQDPHRLEAGITFVLHHNTGNGHTCLPRDKVSIAAQQLLDVPADTVDSVIDRMVSDGSLRAEEFNARVFLFLPYLYEAETFIAVRMQLMNISCPISEEDLQLRIDAMERNFHITYEEQQRQAMVAAIEKGTLILTGGPGTGKTTTLRGIITLLESMGETVFIAAPTGRAAQRIAELTGHEAKTLHRLLEVKWDDSDTPTFERNERNLLEADAIVVDEMSMVDTVLFESLLRAMKTGCRLIMVGDTDQLPAVGAGCVLHDLMDSGRIPVARLDKVFRQALESRIVVNAHRIVSGEGLQVDNTGDCFFLPRSSAKDVVQTVLNLCHQRLPRAYGYTVLDGLQVLSAGRKGEIGTIELNARLQKLINPSQAGKDEITVEGVTLRVGDKVMHTRNNYDIPWQRDDGTCGMGVFNGDIGVLEEIHLREGNLTVRFDDRVAQYTKQDIQDLELAYAITVHKSQGSEFDAVVMPVFRNTPNLCYRNLLYTAVTRAKKLLILVGSMDTVRRMIDNDRKTLRYTGLRTFMERTGIE